MGWWVGSTPEAHAKVVKELAESGQLKMLTISALKWHCKLLKLPVSGTKPLLMARIMQSVCPSTAFTENQGLGDGEWDQVFLHENFHFFMISPYLLGKFPQNFPASSEDFYQSCEKFTNSSHNCRKTWSFHLFLHTIFDPLHWNQRCTHGAHDAKRVSFHRLHTQGLCDGEWD